MPYEGLRQIFTPLIRRKIGQVTGQEHLPDSPPFILAANHTGFMDALVLAILVLERYRHRIRFITKRHIWKWWGSYLSRHWLGMIPLEPNKKVASLDEAVSTLHAGEIVGIFPEGTRNTDPHQLARGKTGAIRLALAARVPIIPIGIINHTGYLVGAALKSLWQRDRRVDLHIGPPLDLSPFLGKPVDKQLLESATHCLMATIGQLCGKVYPY